MGTLIKCKKVHEKAVLPEYQHQGDAGFDFVSVARVNIEPGEVGAVPTGLVMEIPDGWELQVRPRSGLSLRSSLMIANAPGTIDSGFRGEVKILVRNLGFSPYNVSVGDRIAQGVLAPVHRAAFAWTEDVTDTTRGEGGFGSTGK